MKLKFLLVIVLLLGEMGFAGRMVLHSNDAGVINTILGIPVLGEMFYEYRIRETKEKAEAGDVHEMMALYYKADSMDEEGDKARAQELLEQSDSATAELFLLVESGASIDNEPSREFMLLVARAMKENIRPFVPNGDANSAYIHQSRHNARAFDVLKERARSGDADAIWVLENMDLSAEG